jgi:uncharacterized protein YbjT (DUF2867 family)
VARVLVVGGTGLAGREVTAEAARRGHDVTVASRRVPDDDSEAYVPDVEYAAVDIVTGDGLDEALDGIDVLIDTTNGVKRSSRSVLTIGAQNLLHGAARWGVGQAVLLSIVNVDESSYSYYQAKTLQERIYRDSILESRVVRATQFHDFVSSLFSSGARYGLIPAFSRVRFQPIAVRDVARVLVDAAEGATAPGAVTSVGGPEVLTSREMAEEWKRATNAHGVIVSSPLPRGLGASWRTGRNLVPEHKVGTTTYSEWLTSRA